MADENKSKDVLVHADHVKVYFKGKDKKSGTVRAVDDISFDIFAGETFGVVGESGCGKSTLGRTLIRLIPATDGHVYLDGEDISGLKGKALKQMRKKAQIIFQDPSACLNKPAPGIKGTPGTDLFLHLPQLKRCLPGQRPRRSYVSGKNGGDRRL